MVRLLGGLDEDAQKKTRLNNATAKSVAAMQLYRPNDYRADASVRKVAKQENRKRKKREQPTQYRKHLDDHAARMREARMREKKTGAA